MYLYREAKKEGKREESRVVTRLPHCVQVECTLHKQTFKKNRERKRKQTEQAKKRECE
uniref:Uncharacterized protein n=1 Tax=Trypanosoma brucei TaxID=5691 RepID=Q583B8_9TRYP|nr:hypothetical protein, unlikely [Trypanosoma brucei]